MSRNGSGRSSYSYKTEEDFKDEILDLKRKLARIKEESKLLKVKLRRSEENAARKEKIICTMIDPMKACLSAKSARAQNKVLFTSQKKEHLMKTPSSNSYCQAVCSRAYRHNFNPTVGVSYGHTASSSEDLSRNCRKKKCKSKLTASVENVMCDAYDLSHNSSNLNLLTYDKLKKDSKGIYDNYPVVIGSGDEVKHKGIVNVDKRRGKASSSHKRTSVAKIVKEKISSKKKKSMNEKTVKSQSFELYTSSENDDDSSSFSVAKEPIKASKKVRKGVSLDDICVQMDHDYDSCKQCQLKALKIRQNEIESIAACSIENLIHEGKKILSMWDENEHHANSKKQKDERNCKSNVTEETLEEKEEYGYNKFGMYLINENDEADEMEALDKVVAGNGPTKIENLNESNVRSKSAPSWPRERRASIFRVDIKKKEPKVENDCSEESDSSREIGYVVKGSENAADIEKSVSVTENADELIVKNQDLSEVGCNLDDVIVKEDKSVKMLENLIGSLTFGDQQVVTEMEVSELKSNHFHANNGESHVEILENGACQKSQLANKNGGECHKFCNLDTLYGGHSKCCRTFLSSETSNKIETLFHKVNHIPIQEDFVGIHNFQGIVDEEEILLDIISQSNDASTIINT